MPIASEPAPSRAPITKVMVPQKTYMSNALLDYYLQR